MTNNFVFVVTLLSFVFMKFLNCARNLCLKSRDDSAKIGHGFLHPLGVTGLLTGHNTLRRHLYLLRLIDSPLCRACGVKEETSAHVLCECEALASLTHISGLLFLGARGY